MNWGKNVQKTNESKLGFWHSGFNWIIFSNTWKFLKMGHELKWKLFDPYIFEKTIK